MTIPTGQDPLVRSFPEHLSRRWLRLFATDLLVLAALFLGYKLLARTEFHGWKYAYVLIGFGLITPTIYSRVYTYGTMIAEPYIKYVLQDYLWKANDKGWRAWARRLYGPLPNPGAITEIGTELATLYRAEDRTDTVIILGDGSKLLGMNWLEQAMYYEDIETTIRQLAGALKLDLGIGWHTIIRPTNVTEADEEKKANIVPRIYGPHALDPERPPGPLLEQEITDLEMHELLVEIFEQEVDNCADVQMAMVLKIKRTPALHRAARKKQLKSLQREPIMRLAHQAKQALIKRGVYNVSIADVNDLRLRIRMANTVVTLNEYYELDDEQAQRQAYAPQQDVLVTDKACCIDGTWHTAMMITGGPPEIPIWDLRDLLHSGCEWISYASPSETRNWRSEYTFINYVVIPVIEVIRSAFGINRSGEAGIAGAARRVERQRRLFYQRWSQHMNIFLGVAAENEERLDDEFDTLASHVRDHGFSFVRISRRQRQVRAAYTANTCCNLL